MRSLSFYIYSLYHYLLRHAWEYPTIEPDLEASRVEPLSLEAILSCLEPRRQIINLVPPEGQHWPPLQTPEGECRWEPTAILEAEEDGKEVWQVQWGWWFYPNSKTIVQLGRT